MDSRVPDSGRAAREKGGERMKVLLMDGRLLLIPLAKTMQYASANKELEVIGPRKRVLATFTVANIVGYWYDNEDVSFEMPAL